MDFKLIEQAVDEIFDEIVAFRRELHMTPEVSDFEVITPQKIAERLKKIPIEVKEKVGRNGVVGLIRGKNSENSKTILLRADMDALPINEESGVEFSSKIPNVMHACGHDMHCAMLLGAATVLSKFRDELDGNVKFMFQPAEELAPTGGSRAMMADGVLENPKVDEAYALHVYGVPTGAIAFRPGVANSRSDRIKIEIIGKSAHGSLPNEGKDAIVAAANVITGVQSIISRNLGPSENAVITIGTIKGGDRYNVISETVTLEGTVRTFSDKVVNLIKERLAIVVNDIASAYGCIGKLNYYDGYDFIYNDLKLSQNVIDSLTPILGKENIIIQENPLPTGEDFSFVTKKVPSVFMWLGTESEVNNGRCILHNSKFLADENTIKYGIKVMCKVVIDSFSKKS
ncbi:MAG: amidohydrolase [Fusobacteriaceae bacterium]|jgi:amidohydrolase|nr:amidohydrolase [Fusobacteriaceae bacterium]